MNNEIEYIGYKRINKAKARKEYNNGNVVFILPCKVRFNNEWIQPCIVSKDFYDNEDFDKIANAYKYYNCQYNETGKYASYYIKEAN